MDIKSEASLTTFESIAMIVGHSIGTGIIAVPYLATKNNFKDVLWMIGLAYIINVILHLLIAELSLNNGGKQLVKSFEGELFQGKFKKIFSWLMFIGYGLAIIIGVSGNINGGAAIFNAWFGIPFHISQILYYILAGSVVFMGMKAVGMAQKFTVMGLFAIVGVITIMTFINPIHSIHTYPRHLNNMLALYSMVVFATSANQAVIQSVKGLGGNAKKIRISIFVGFGISSLLALIVTFTVLLGVQGELNQEMAYLQLGKSLGPVAMTLTALFSLLALTTTFWSHTLSLRDVVHEQVDLNLKLCWVLATLPSILFALFGIDSFIILTRIMSGVVVLVGIMLIFAYNKSRRKAKTSPICGIFGTLPFQLLMVISTIISAVGALIPLA